MVEFKVYFKPKGSILIDDKSLFNPGLLIEG
jgi:hypothetical protein